MLAAVRVTRAEEDLSMGGAAAEEGLAKTGSAAEVELAIGGPLRRRSATSDAPVPLQLKPPPVQFTNRVAEVVELDRLLDERRARPSIHLISGPAGVGKTALATHWLHRIRARFPRGQLGADHGGFSPTGPVDPGEVLGRFLRALGVPPSGVPIGVEEQAALYRTITAHQPLLVLLDNAASSEQVRPLIPAGPTSVVVVTSRRRLGGLLRDEGARLLSLEAFNASQSKEMLSRTVGAAQVRTEVAAAGDIVELCGGLPIALAVMGAQLAARPQSSTRRVATRLAKENRRLSVLSPEEDVSVQAAFDLSYHELSAEAAALYRTLGLHPGAEFGTGVASAAVDSPVDEVEDLLDQLVEVGLLQLDDGRFTFLDLIRLHAEEKLAEHDSAETREEALRRILEWYLHIANVTAELTTPDQKPIRYEFAYRPSDRMRFESRDDGLKWLELERANLIAAIRTAAERDLNELGWQLAAAMRPLFLHKHYRDFLAVSKLGVVCAERWENRSAQAVMHNRCGAACRATGRFDEAVEHYQRGLATAPGGDNPATEIRSMEGLGLVALAQDRAADAVGYFEEDLRLSTELDRPHDVGLALINLGAALTKAGNAPDGIERLTRAKELLAGQGDDYNVARAQTDLARALGLTGEFAKARDEIALSQATMRARGSLFEQARALQVLGEVTQAAGETAEARRLYEHALAVLVDLRRPEAAQVQFRLYAL
jgi:tetratricopeptide (TPR) repeat protein